MLISLKRRAVASLDLAVEERLRLITPQGCAWVTLEGCDDDFALSSSDPLTFVGPGRLVVEALEDDMLIRAESLGLPARQTALLAAS